MDGDDERTDKDSGRSQTGSPQNNPKTNTAATDSSSGETGIQTRSENRRRRSRRHQRNHSRSGNREGLNILQANSQEVNAAAENASVPSGQRRKRRRRNHPRKYNKPYTMLSWEERMERDEAESERATRRRANRPTPYNTTQFLMEDHKADTPDLSGPAENINENDVSEETFEEDFRNGEYLEKNFSEVYDEVQTERLQAMSKEQLVQEVLALSKRVTELDEIRRRTHSDCREDTVTQENKILVQKGISETFIESPSLQKVEKTSEAFM